MYKYAEIYGGKVRDLKESYLGYTEFCSIFDPASYWLDVTGVEDIGIGWLIKFSPDVGTYFEEPDTPIVIKTLETAKNAKLEVLSAVFEREANHAYVVSSLGFSADANETANRNISGLVTITADNPDELISFCDYDNFMQYVNHDQLVILQKEVIKNGSYFYMQKWAFRDAIEEATSEEELDAIDIKFKNMNFLNPEEENTSTTVEDTTTSENTVTEENTTNI